MKKLLSLFTCFLLTTGFIYSDKPILLSESVTSALAREISGETAKRNLEYLARQHRMRGSRGFRAAAEHIAEQLKTYGLSDVRIEQFPTDGKTFYGTQKSRPAWDAGEPLAGCSSRIPWGRRG